MSKVVGLESLGSIVIGVDKIFAIWPRVRYSKEGNMINSQLKVERSTLSTT